MKNRNIFSLFRMSSSNKLKHLFLQNLNEEKIIAYIDKGLYAVWHDIWFRLLDYSLSLIFITTFEKEFKNKTIKDNLAFFILSISLTILLTPIGFPFFLTWVILIRIVFRKQPYKLSKIGCESHLNSLDFNKDKNYEILSTNLCLLPECVSRINNLHETDKRLVEVAKILGDNSQKPAASNTEVNNNEEIERFIHIVDDYEQHSHNIDFICIQEIWTVQNGNKLKQLLQHKYPYIVYDIGINGFSSNCLIGLDSGLMLCSKYPILKVQFKSFKEKIRTCRLSSKGLLIAKVFLGKNKDNKNVVGFISNTHLQSYQESTNIHSLQMDDMLNWLNAFRNSHTDPDNDVIAFDIICGDFNMDSYSPVDKNDLNHQLLQDYEDPVCLKPGIDHPDSIGTEMRQFSLYDEAISTPEKFKEALLNDRLRRWYVFDANIDTATLDMLKERPEKSDDGLPVLIPNVSGKRRVDKIIFNKDYKLNVKRYKFITSMTRLTDHIPISMEFKMRFKLSICLLF